MPNARGRVDYEIGDVVRYARGSKAVGHRGRNYATVVCVERCHEYAFRRKPPERSLPMIRAA